MALPTLDATFASAADLPRRQMLAQWLVNLQYSGSVADYWTLPEHYLWAKIAVAAGAPRSEADYISLPKNYVWSDLYNAVSGSSGQTIDRGEKEALGWIAAAVRGDTADPAKVATYISWPWRYQVASIITSLAVDANAQSFITASGATDIEGIDQFVKGIKNLNLWNSMVCWPLRSSQNAGTGTTAYSLGGLGTFNGTLVDGPTWGADGIVVANTNRRITTSFNYATALPSLLAVVSPDSAASTALGDRYASNDQAGSVNGIGFDSFVVNTFRGLAAAVPSFGMRVAGTRTMVGLGWGMDNTFTFQNGTRTGAANTSYNASTQTLCPIGGPQQGTALGVYSFTVAFDGPTPSAATLLAFYTLYKQTLGAGLGLP